MSQPEFVSMGELSHYSSVTWWPGWGRDASPSMLEVHERAAPVPLLAAILRRAGPESCVGSKLIEIWLSQSPSCEHRRAVPITHLPYAFPPLLPINT